MPDERAAPAVDVFGPLYRPLKQGRLTQEIVARLTDLIMSGQLRPGDYLPREEDLSVRLGVSRTAVREAIRVLETRRLVAPKPGVGTVVTDGHQAHFAEAMALSIRGERISADDLLGFRRLIEGHAAFLAATHATEEEIEALRNALARMVPVAGRDQDPVEADVDFHVTLAEASHNALLALVIGVVRDVLRSSIQRTLPMQHRQEMRVAFHQRIVEAIVARDPGAAREAIREHLDDTERLLRAARPEEA